MGSEMCIRDRTITDQVSAKKARETFGDSGVAAIEEEISSLLKKKVFFAVLKSSLSESQRKKMIRMSCFVRDKDKLDA